MLGLDVRLLLLLLLLLPVLVDFDVAASCFSAHVVAQPGRLKHNAQVVADFDSALFGWWHSECLASHRSGGVQ